MRPSPTPAVLLVAAVVLAACGGTAGGPSGQGPSGVAEAEQEVGRATGGASGTTAPDARGASATPDEQPPATTPPDGPAGNAAALDFTAPALSGGQIRGADYAGGDVVLWMWAPW